MRNIITFTTLCVVATGILTSGVASASTGHREPVRATVRNPVVERKLVDRRELGRPVIRDHREVEARGRNDGDRDDARRFGGWRGERVRYDRETIGERYFDVRFRPAPRIEDPGLSQAGYVWVTGDWQWDGAEWIWVAGHYEAAY